MGDVPLLSWRPNQIFPHHGPRVFRFRAKKSWHGSWWNVTSHLWGPYKFHQWCSLVLLLLCDHNRSQKSPGFDVWCSTHLSLGFFLWFPFCRPVLVCSHPNSCWLSVVPIAGELFCRSWNEKNRRWCRRLSYPMAHFTLSGVPAGQSVPAKFYDAVDYKNHVWWLNRPLFAGKIHENTCFCVWNPPSQPPLTCLAVKTPCFSIIFGETPSSFSISFNVATSMSAARRSSRACNKWRSKERFIRNLMIH